MNNQTFHHWSVWVNFPSRRNAPASRADTMAEIQASFEHLGFTVSPQRFLYYNPTRDSRFIVTHPNAGAMMLWQIAHGAVWQGWVPLTIEEYDE